MLLHTCHFVRTLKLLLMNDSYTGKIINLFAWECVEYTSSVVMYWRLSKNCTEKAVFYMDIIFTASCGWMLPNLPSWDWISQLHWKLLSCHWTDETLTSLIIRRWKSNVWNTDNIARNTGITHTVVLWLNRMLVSSWPWHISAQRRLKHCDSF